MISKGHRYNKGHCPYCGKADVAIDGMPQCDCYCAEAVRSGEMTHEEAMREMELEEKKEKEY